MKLSPKLKKFRVGAQVASDGTVVVVDDDMFQQTFGHPYPPVSTLAEKIDHPPRGYMYEIGVTTAFRRTYLGAVLRPAEGGHVKRRKFSNMVKFEGVGFSKTWQEEYAKCRSMAGFAFNEFIAPIKAWTAENSATVPPRDVSLPAVNDTAETLSIMGEPKGKNTYGHPRPPVKALYDALPSPPEGYMFEISVDRSGEEPALKCTLISVADSRSWSKSVPLLTKRGGGTWARDYQRWPAISEGTFHGMLEPLVSWASDMSVKMEAESPATEDDYAIKM